MVRRVPDFLFSTLPDYWLNFTNSLPATLRTTPSRHELSDNLIARQTLHTRFGMPLAS
ncbi:hypothetical protein [uncultured Erythrobacter sp.]|uniref:hypothetical protein n=1 Tax=uncultured Erythrobacter sp. TaxID=263913 RepID=UPI00261947A2|nr:hypothetical protein [uncultured Erythrobacter sp.]